MEYAILYNPHSCGGNGLKAARKIEVLMGENTYTYHDFTEINSLEKFFEKIGPSTDVILTGGDGTLNRFINKLEDINLERKIYFYAAGSGNDFARDIKLKTKAKPICINEYLKNLPTTVINGKSYKFINCVGCGLDGYCCFEAERLRRISNKRSNYMLSSVKGLLYAYKPCTATVNADGKEYSFENTWVIPVMNGKFFGGGFMAAPDQNRVNSEQTLSLVAMHSRNFFKIIIAFLLLFTGKHTRLKSVITIIEGHEFKIKLNHKATLEIDGEIIPDVSEYTVSSAKVKAKV